MGGWVGTGPPRATGTSRRCPVPRHNNEKTFLIWINEEDHTRVISMEKGGNMKRVFERFCRGLKEVSAWQPPPCQPHGQADGQTEGQGQAGLGLCAQPGWALLGAAAMPRAGHSMAGGWTCASVPGGAAYPGARLGVHVE